MSASLSRLQSFYGELKVPFLLHAVIKREFTGTVALLTSFAHHAGLLLSMAAEIDPVTPILFLDTGKHSPETLQYGRSLATHLGLTRVHWLAPDRGPDSLAHTLETMGFLALITERTASGLQRIELDENGVFRINPLAGWTKEQQESERVRRNIPPHPLGAAADPESYTFAGEPEAMDATHAPAVDWNL